MIRIVLILCSLYLAFGALLYVTQRNLIYFPTEPVGHGNEEIIFLNNGVSITSILLNNGKRNAILYFGGNAETVAFNATDFESLFSDYSIYLINYRGYGGSSGNPEESALFSDSLKIYDEVTSKYDSVSVIGRSLGSGVASFLASERDVSKLVLITPFDSMQNVAQEQFPLYPMSLLLMDKFNSIERVKDINSEVFILVAENDQVISKARSENLINSFIIPTRVEVIKDANHNDISIHTRYYQSIQEFL
jgi:uncharacterized protein